MPVIESWSTADVPRSERFALWREVRARNLFGVTAELDRHERASFQGSFTTMAVGSARILEVHATPYFVRRTQEDIRLSPGDSLCLYAQTLGGGWFQTPRGDFVVQPGRLAMSYSDAPYATRPTEPNGYHFQIVKIPIAAWGSLGEWRGTEARLAVSGTGLDAMLAACFASFLSEAANLQGAAAETAVETLVTLALGVRRGLIAGERGRAAVQEGRRTQVLRFIERHFADPRLSVSTIAAALHLSERQLHLLFEPTGISLSRRIARRRLETARRRIEQGMDPTIAATAFACGFDSLATFYRAFKAVYDTAPGDLRGKESVD